MVLLALVMAAGCRIERTPRASGDDPVSVAREEIELMVRNYQESLIAGDTRRAASVFTPDARLYLPDTPVITGRGDIDRAFAGRFDSERVLDLEMEFEGTDVGIGVAHQFGVMRQLVRDTAGKEREIDGRIAIRWIRAADSEWRINRLLINYAPTDSAVVADSISAMSR